MRGLFSVVLISAVIVVLVLSLVACAPGLTEQIQLTNAQANMANAQAASIRAEGDRAIQNAQAYAITSQAMQQADYQTMLNKLVWLQEADGSIIENTWWAIVILFVVLSLLIALVLLQLLVLVELRKK